MSVSEAGPAERVYVFGTCLIDLLAPETGIAAIEVLEAAGFEVLFPSAQTCCGQPAFNSGYSEEARKVALAQLDLFPAPWPLIVPSGSCAAMIRHDYPALLQGHPREQEAIELAARTYEWCEFLNRVAMVELEDQGAPLHVVMHTSCSARRTHGVHQDGLALLAQLKNVRVSEAERAEECCGFGGTFCVKSPALSTVMTDDKCDALCATGAQELLSSDCGCLLSLNGRLDRRQLPLRGQHIAQFIRDRIHPAAAPATAHATAGE